MEADNDSSDPTTSMSDNPKFQGVFEIFNWENTQSNLLERPPSTRIPPATEPTSAFLDLQQMTASMDGRKIAEAIPAKVIGTKFQADTKFIQLFFEEETEADAFIRQRTLAVGDCHIPILPPKGKPLPRTLLKIDNVPILGKKKLTKTLTELLANYCCPLEVAPITIKKTKWLTSRWEAVVETIPDKKLKGVLPPVLEFEGQKILLSWAGSTPTCIQCMSAGHLRKNCPKRAPKTAPVPKTKAVAQQQRTVPTPSPQHQQTYANIAAQGTPENNIYTTLNDIDDAEYQGPTSLYEASTSDSQIQTTMQESSTRTSNTHINRISQETPEPQNMEQGLPIHDTESSFLGDYTDVPAQPLPQYRGQNNKKRALYVSPNRSPTPQRLPSTNPLNIFTNPSATDNTDTLSQ